MKIERGKLVGATGFVQRGVEGDDIHHIIVFVPTGVSNMEEAIDNALDKAGADYLTDAKIYSSFWYIPYILPG